MNGSAPNWPATGSQVSVRQNANPNFRMDSIDWRVSSNPIAATIATTSSANAPVASLNPRSCFRMSAWSLQPALRYRWLCLDLGQCRHLHLNHIRRKRRVPEIGAVFLAIGQRPFQDVDHDLCLSLVLGVLVQQQPRERRDGIGAFA